ncbi:MAG: hypothetical protein HYU41_01585 [Candidatus Rokubacteria bacterium]|nr:hypothetical protein [Candidatus Rokubacteria bacterium]
MAADVEDDSAAVEVRRIADHLLTAGAVWVCAWGPGAGRLEDIFDDAAIANDPGGTKPVICTTAHADERIEEAFEFAISAALPASEYSESCRAVVAVFVGNVNWYNDTAMYLEDALDAP